MESPISGRGGREVRLLIATIAVSLIALLLLARLRFPETAVETARPAPAPLERLAAQASYADLASAMTELERRVGPALLPVTIRPARPSGASAVAVRVTPDRAVVVLDRAESLVTVAGASPNLLFRDTRGGVAVVAVEADANRVATPRTGTPRPEPRYVAVAQASDGRPILSPVYVAATQLVDDPIGGGQVLTVAAPQQLLPRGAAVFTLAGAFAGLVVDAAGGRVVPAEMLVALAGQPSAPALASPADLGIDVQPLNDSLARIAGADVGVVVSSVDPAGPAADLLQPGDVIQSVNDVPVRTVAEFEAVAQSRTPGAPIPVARVRRAQASTVQVVPREAPLPKSTAATEGHGLVLRLVRGRGLQVTGVAPGSAGDAAGLRPGDLVTTIDGEPPASVRDLDSAYSARDGGLLLSVQRGATRLVAGLEKR